MSLAPISLATLSSKKRSSAGASSRSPDGGGTGSAAARTAKSEMTASTANMVSPASNLTTVRDVDFCTDLIGRTVRSGMMPPLVVVESRPQPSRFCLGSSCLLGNFRLGPLTPLLDSPPLDCLLPVDTLIEVAAVLEDSPQRVGADEVASAGVDGGRPAFDAASEEADAAEQ